MVRELCRVYKSWYERIKTSDTTRAGLTPIMLPREPSEVG